MMLWRHCNTLSMCLKKKLKNFILGYYELARYESLKWIESFTTIPKTFDEWSKWKMQMALLCGHHGIDSWSIW
jgi:hypothetical protein